LSQLNAPPIIEPAALDARIELNSAIIYPPLVVHRYRILAQ
jgi:hypothetical protein